MFSPEANMARLVARQRDRAREECARASTQSRTMTTPVIATATPTSSSSPQYIAPASSLYVPLRHSGKESEGEELQPVTTWAPSSRKSTQ